MVANITEIRSDFNRLGRSDPRRPSMTRVNEGPRPNEPDRKGKQTILVVDDEKDLVDLIAYNLQRNGYNVLTATSGDVALDIASRELPKLILLDLMLPGMSGTEVARKLKADVRTATIPIIMLTAKSEETDVVVGLTLGADDYVTKPFSPRELILRINRSLRRGKDKVAGVEKLAIGDLMLDHTRHEVLVKNRPVDLTATEFRLLALLMERRGRVQGRDSLLNDVWGYESVIDTRTVDTHVRRLREKLGPLATYIETIRGVGYRISEGTLAQNSLAEVR
jgi:two-component system phosphate regulon response regulator PhoB